MMLAGIHDELGLTTQTTKGLVELFGVEDGDIPVLLTTHDLGTDLGVSHALDCEHVVDGEGSEVLGGGGGGGGSGGDEE